MKWHHHFLVLDLHGQNFREWINNFNDDWLLRSIHVNVYAVLRKQFAEVYCQSLALSAPTINCEGTRTNAVGWKDSVKSAAPILEGNLAPFAFMTYDGASKPSALVKTFALFTDFKRHFELVVFTR